jgi:hypothetical protein
VAERGLSESDAVGAVGTGRSPRTVRARLRAEWEERGFLDSDPRAQALRKALVTQPGVRHIVTDRISLDPTVDAAVLHTIVTMLQQAPWLVSSVVIE